MIWTIARWTFHTIFRTWFGWLGLSSFVFLNGFVLWMLLNSSGGQNIELHRDVLPSFFSTMSLLMLFLCPSLTMGSISGEITNSRWTIYQTAPLSPTTIILGKVLGLSGYTSLLLLSTIPFIGWLNTIGECLLGRWALSYLGVALLSFLFICIGVLSSSKSKRPLGAWLLSMSVCIASWFMGTLDGTIWFHLSPLPKFHEYMDGWIGLSDTWYWISSIGLLLWLAQDSVEQRRWFHSRPLEDRVIPFMWLMVFGLSNTVMDRYDRYWDINPIRMTLQPETLDIIRSIEDPLIVTVDVPHDDSRYRMVENILRQMDSETEVIIRRLNQQSRPPGQMHGLFFEWKETSAEITGAIYPATIHQTLKELIQPIEPTLCITQGGGEPNIFNMDDEKGLGRLSESLIQDGYQIHPIRINNEPVDTCDVLAIIGRTNPIPIEWINQWNDTPKVVLIDPTTNPSWLSERGIRLQDNFVIEPNPNFNLNQDPSTLVVSPINLQPHPTFTVNNQQITLQGLRSIQWDKTNTQSLGVELIHTSSQAWAEMDYSSENPKPDETIDLIGRIPILVEVSTVQKSIPKTILLVMGTSSLVHNKWVQHNPFNAHFFIQMIDHLRGRKAIPVQQSIDRSITLNTQKLNRFGWVGLGVYPAIFIVFGLVSTFRRR